jgi:hypothetical protein
MKLPYKITLISIVSVILVVLLIGLNETFTFKDFAVRYGIVGFLTGCGALVAGILTAVIGTTNKGWMLGFFLTAAILLLTGFLGLTQFTFTRA